MKKMIVVSVFVLFLLVGYSFASGSDHGIVGGIILDLIKQIPIVGGRLALPIFGVIVVGVVTVANVLLRRILDVLPVTWHENGVNLFWQVMAFLFGDEVLLRGAKLDAKCPEKAAEALRKKVIAKSPVLSIPVPWEKK